jgi:hypothetical protein
VGSVLELACSTSSSTSVPTRAWLASSPIRSWSATRRWKRSLTTSGGTWSGMDAASVPGRGEYWKVNAESKRASSTMARVSAKSASVSPGKPTMMSVEQASPGMAARRLPRISR